MCQIAVSNSNGFTTLSKEKLDGNVETVTISSWAKPAVLHAIKSAATCSTGLNTKVSGYRVLTTREGNYLSIRNLKRGQTLFVPRDAIGQMITSFENA